MMNILEANNLTIKIDKFTLNIDELHVRKGSIFHLKGENGVGKTVLLNTLMGFMEYSGNLNITTKDVTGFVANDSLIPYLYPYEYFEFIDKLNSATNFLENCRSFSELLKLEFDEKKYIRDLSEGNKQKVGLISILSLESDLMIFDEPYAHLDDYSCSVLDNLFLNKSAESTILFSSHLEAKVANESFEIIASELL